MTNDERDYLDEALRILQGTTLMRTQREHLAALYRHFTKPKAKPDPS